MKVFCAVLLLALLGRAGALEAKAGISDDLELEGFVDGMLEAQKKAHPFAGAVVVIVRDGQIVLSKGYGYANFAERKPVDPKRTLFRVASNSKMFVWTAVMQLVEQGKLELHRDANQYLQGVHIPETFPEPVTIEHLMTHTAGFEDKIVGLFSRTPDRLRPLAEMMSNDMPARIYPPGKVTAYSNYGTALAALIVEQVSGLPFEKYLKERVLDPLGMKYSTMGQPVPKELAPYLSNGYQWKLGHLTEKPFEYVPWAPCGAMSISGEDMGRFMIAHLNDGVLGEGRILRLETAREMRENLISFSPKLNGMLHGFMERSWNGQKIYGHDGDTVWFHSVTAMLPAQRMGVFVAYNTDTGSAARSEFSPAFLDHYFPTPIPKEPPAAKEARTSLSRFEGTYATARVSESDITKIRQLIDAVSVVIDSEGHLVTSGSKNGRWRQIESGVFAELNGKRQLVFRQDADGQVTDACTSPICVVAYRKQPWWDARTMQFGYIGICLAILMLALVGLPVAAVSQRREPASAGSKLARLNAWLASLLLLAGFATVGLAMSDLQEIVFGVPPGVGLGLGLLVAGSFLSLALAAFTVAAWRRSWWRMEGRVSVTLICSAACGAVLWLNHWNLLGWKY